MVVVGHRNVKVARSTTRKPGKLMTVTIDRPNFRVLRIATLAVWNAICSPSGDQNRLTGAPSSVGVSRRISVPSDSIK